jgi:hypothetical protein
MASENVYIALIINANNYPNLSQYDIIISLLNNKFPNNKLSYYKYLTDGSTIQTTESLDNFIDNTKFSLGKRAVVSITTTILTDCSTYISSKGLNILNISINATSNNIKNLTNTLTYTPLNQYAVMSMFMTYVDLQMDYIHVLYGESSNIGLVDLLEQTRQQASFLNIPLEVSTLRNNVSDYNIKPKSMIIMLGLTNDLTNIYITPDFISKIPTNCYITLTTANTLIKDIFGNIPAFVVCPTNINYTVTTKEVYNSVKNNSSGYDYTSYAFYDVLFVLNDFSTNGLELTKENYTSVNPYRSSPPAWLLNTSLSPIINSAPYGKYQYTFTKDVIVGNDKTLFLQYYDGGQQQLPDSYSIFKIAGITPNNPSLIEYDDADYYKIYDKHCNLVAVKFNSDIVNFPDDKNLNIGKTCLTRFIYKFNNEGYFSKLERLLPGDGILPLVNSTMSKKIKKIVYK